MEYNKAVDNLLKGIGDNYANWGWAKPGPNTDRVNEFRNGLKVKPGRKFDKVIESNRVWGFIAKTDGVHKGIPHKKGDVFKAAGWRAPAKWSRGSIFSNDKFYTWTGPNYLI